MKEKKLPTKIKQMTFPERDEYRDYPLNVITMQKMWDKIQELVEAVNKLKSEQ